MQFKLTIALLALFAVAAANASTHPQLQYVEQRLASALLRSSASFENNPSRSFECFSKYIETLNEVTKTYETAYAACGTSYDTAMEELDAANSGKRDELNELATSTCQQFAACNENVHALDFFQCHYKAGNEGYKTTYTISSKADQYSKDVGKKQSDIVFAKDNCNGECKAKYEKDADATFEDLQVCLNEPDTSSTSAPTTTSSEAPVEPEARAAVHSFKVMQHALRQH